MLQKGDLAFWIAPGGDKFWVLIACPRKWHRGPGYYAVSDHSGCTYSAASLVPATIDQIIRYNRRKWGYSARRTRNAIKQARKLL